MSHAEPNTSFAMSGAQRTRLVRALTMMLAGHSPEVRQATAEHHRKARQARKNRRPSRQAWWAAKQASEQDDPATLEMMKRYDLL
ncbi:hypothetical protein [Pseudomonas capsici]|uniref:Uncharacterized protein n=1 Tax=Pseudomonas capsici TaxID=2810614 RepID=A0ABT3BT37_9PSED|nr:hypothetical protein [Pseudomonas capsici]MCV4266677.1 hypothetical protein [Pseudomonas capsici]MCV4277732.1 hypothetical protein [Pseudomonas capsici]MCV4331283.1 hypothetical protein [Pseudomonas capsici]MCV4376019.1 hypothetical protein [Pseudomonas capsici]